MFGTYRMLLALMVALEHLGGTYGMGAFAVMGFYLLSGYLMTLIMHDYYGYTKPGIIRYAINRFLKIYPIYWAVLFLSLIVVLYLGEDFSSALWRPMYLPDNLPSILRNLFIFFP